MKPLLFTFLFFSIFGVEARSASAPIEAIAPCSNTIAKGADSKTGLHACAEYLASLEDQLKQRLQKQTQSYYQGFDYSPRIEIPQKSYPKPLCCLVTGPFCPSAEEARNNLGESCGAPIDFDVKIKVSLTGKVDVRVTARSDATRGAREDSYRNASILAALGCYWEQALSEIKASKKITVRPILGEDSVCSANARDFNAFSTQQRKLLVEQIQAHPNISDILNYANTFNPSSEGQELGPLRMSALKLASTRTDLETAFIRLVECEIIQQSGQSVTSAVGTPTARDQLIKSVIEAKIPDCQRECSQKAGESCGTSCQQSTLTACLAKIPPGSNQAEALLTSCYDQQLGTGSGGGGINERIAVCVNQCYQRGVAAEYRKRFSSYWPSQPTGAQSCRGSN